jgi:arylsulfatase A-like enzyme
MNRKLIFSGWLACLAILTFSLPIQAQQSSKPNILFIAIDDLKPILGCYGNTMIKTPNIDRLAKMGTVFLNNYCQQAVCGPTRASLMTGKRPDYTKVWDLKTPMRNVNPDILSLPQYLISQGYSTQGIGKVYDPRNVDKELDIPSWSVPYYKTNKKYYAAGTGEPANGQYQDPTTKALIEKYAKEAEDKKMSDADAKAYVQSKIKPAVEKTDLPNNAYNDGANVLQARDILGELSKSKKPFFLAVGLAKPHLPFVAPKKYWDMYKREDMPLAKYQQVTSNPIEPAYHTSGEIRAYTDIEPVEDFSDMKVGVKISEEKQRELIHAYYAAISFTDANVGVLLNTLDSLGLTKNTIVVLWGDHGWHLGDHNLWCKHSNFEQATHAPLIIAAPGIASNKTSSISEHLDIFPTLCELAGVEIPKVLDGKSLVPLMKNSKAVVNEFAVSQYPRGAAKEENTKSEFSGAKVMGYSIRTNRYRFTIWMDNNWRSSKPYNASSFIGSELYDYQKDPEERNNVFTDKKYAAVAKEMEQKMMAFFKTQVR